MLFHSTPADNWVGRLNPLVKVVLLGAAAVTVFFLSDIRVLAVLFLAVVAAIRLGRMEFGRAALVIRLFLLTLPFLYLIFILSYAGKGPTFTDSVRTGLAEATRYSLRFLILILVNFAVVLSTDPREVIVALRALHVPAVISQILAHVINLLPLLTDEIRAIVEAQTARGMRWRNMWRPSHWMPVALPVIVSAMRFSEQTAISLELRGGHGAVGPVLPRFTAADWIVGVLCIMAAGCSAAAYYLL